MAVLGIGTAQALFFFSFFLFLPPLFKTTEGVVVGFQIFAWAPKKNNKNLCKKQAQNLCIAA
jgi:hypothetical protein